MFSFNFKYGRALVVTLFLLLVPVMVFAQQEQIKPGAPPVEQPLVTEGAFAVSLGAALDVVTTDDEIEAETRLGDLGILPRNGWIAEYPVTPDVFLEIQNALSNAVAEGSLSMNKEQALKRLTDVAVEFGLSVRPYSAGATYEPTAASCANYPNPAAIYDNYSREGAPVVTYYCPPPDYYYLYTWVPCPFWWADLWFPGFFILHDFHKVVHVRHRVGVVRNHFNDVRTHRAFRIDPLARFSGKTFGGIGVSRPRDFIPTGIQRSERTIFNEPRASRMLGGEKTGPTIREEERGNRSPRGSERGGSPSGGRGGFMERGGRR